MTPEPEPLSDQFASARVAIEAEVVRLRVVNAKLLKACKAGLRQLIMSREVADEGGYGGSGNEMCAEAKAMNPAIKQLQKIIKEAEARP